MTLILALDVATIVGWAMHDSDANPSAMVSGSLRLVGDTVFDKVADMRRKLPRLILDFPKRPDFAAIEAPLEFAPQFKKVRKDMLGTEEVGTTINSKTIAMLNRLAGAAAMAVMGQNIRCVEVSPRTWQAIMPKNLPGNTKARAKAYCESLRIVSPNMDSRDACVIALWAAGHCQELKMLERARAAA